MMALKKALVMSTYTLNDAPSMFVRIRGDGGSVGWGEAAPNIIMSGETLGGMQHFLNEYVTPLLKGRPLDDWKACTDDLIRMVYANRGAIAATSMALLDLAARSRRQPAIELLGGARRSGVMVLRLVGGSGATDRDVEEVLGLHQLGYRAFKLKVGVGSVEVDIQTIKTMRRSLGDDVLIGADANMGWDYDTAYRFMTAVRQYDLAFLEQPFAVDDVELCARLVAETGCNLAIDEAMHHLGDMLVHQRAGAIRGVGLKSVKLGGPTPLVEVGRQAYKHGLSVNLAMMMESSLATAAMVHTACALPAIAWGLSLGSEWIADDPVSGGPRAESGVAALPSGIGWGVDVDEERLRRIACS